ncbi:TOP3A [Enterospora canceri]|uniref:DNA topoisomerase n=1 Tax=Enterospora canceri TaxID=1081671 RepID=A0A1Y1S787_9MICR|nr:TOP3A [Enterospora canceri]
MLIVNVAEKPSVAKSISRILSKSVVTTKSPNKYCMNHNFKLDADQMVFTSVLGHLVELNFAPEYRNWGNTDPYDLFDGEITRDVRDDLSGVKKNITKLADEADMVVIWTDCDREGENIGKQIKDLCGSTLVKRARFSGISKHEIMNAFSNLQEINQNESDAVEARMELDLRCGSAFSRLQTMALSEKFGNQKKVISYGQCQIPTLNFVVQRHKQINEFVPEQFYSLIAEDNGNEFTWKRGNLFDKNCVIHFYNEIEKCDFIVESVECAQKTKFKPIPLRTVEFQKICTSYYKIPGAEVMRIAEKLYNQGYISYPRTETDSFGSGFGYQRILDKLKADDKFTEYLNEMEFKTPRKGKNNDQAHSPIYPLKSGTGLSGKDRNVYEMVARRFIACCSDDARGLETVIKIRPNSKAGIKEEQFICKGLKITEQNYLKIYIYDTWNNKNLRNPDNYETGKIMMNSKIEIKDGATTAPSYLTEKDLINLMDKNGIGTDATIHEHINKIQIREYASKSGQFIKPTELGINLINAYNLLGLEISECKIRKEMEENLVKVCKGEIASRELVQREIGIYKKIFIKFRNKIDQYKRIMETKQAVETKRSSTTKRFKASDTENRKNSVVECGCKKQADFRQVTKGKNKGKWYYGCCEYPSKCDFFLWDGETKQERINKQQIVVEDVQCQCGKGAVKKTSTTEKTKGRQFYCCNRSYKKCKFFQWAD